MLALFKKKIAAKGITSVVFTEEGVAIAHVQDVSHQPELTFCEFTPSSKPFLEPNRFSELISKNGLQGSQALVVLPESSYQLHLVEPELALLNLTEDLADSEAGLAVFYLGERSSSINLLSDAALYLSRQLSYNKSASPENASGAVLELQRSLDYYESQVGKPPCVRLMVMPLQPDTAPLMEELRQNLHLDIYSLNLNNLLTCNEHLSDELQQSVTIAAAAALRTADNTVEVKG